MNKLEDQSGKNLAKYLKILSCSLIIASTYFIFYLGKDETLAISKLIIYLLGFQGFLYSLRLPKK